MSIRRCIVAAGFVSLSSLSCSKGADSDADADKIATPEPSCTAMCPSESGGGGAPEEMPGAGTAPNAAGGPTTGEGGEGGAEDDGPSAGGSAPTQPPNGGGPSAGGSGSPPDEPEAPGPEPTDPTPSMPSENGGSGGSAVDPSMPDASAGGATPEPEGPAPNDADPSSSRFTAIPVGATDAGLGFWEYLPPGYGEAPSPLLVFTHGAAWQGAGTLETLQELLEVGPPGLIGADEWPNDRPFVVLSPQNPRSGCFDANDIDTFYRYAVETYDIDPARIYHTGQSCGAVGAWNYLAAHLDEFVTAAVLISGDGQAAFDQAGCDLGRVAIWGLHNEMDMSVNSQGTIVPINALLECDPVPDVKLTIYPGETEHDAWTKTYDLSAGNDIYSWLLEHEHP